MQITDYIIDIKDSSLQDRLRLRQVLLDNDQPIRSGTKCFTSEHDANYTIGRVSTTWTSAIIGKSNISLSTFIDKFKKHDQIRNLAIYKHSGEPWTKEECTKIFAFVGDEGTLPRFLNNGIIYPDIGGNYYNWNNPPCSTLLRIAYEDLFPQEQSMKQSSNPFKVGDRVRRIANPTCASNVGSEWVVKNVVEPYLCCMDGLWSHYEDFELVQSAEANYQDNVESLPPTSNEYVEHLYETVKPFTELFTKFTQKEQAMELPEIGSIWVRQEDWCKYPAGEQITVESYRTSSYNEIFYNGGRRLSLTKFLEKFKPLDAANAGTTNQTQKENTMKNTTLNLILALMAVQPEEQTPDATNSKFVGIMMQDSNYLGYIYVNSQDEASAIMAKPENEGKQLHLFSKVGTVQQRPRKVQFTPTVQE